MNQFPMEYWIYFQLGIDIGLIFLILFFLRYLKKNLLSQQSELPQKDEEAPPKTLKQHQIDTSTLDILKSLMESAKDSSEEFDRLIQEKKMLITMFDEKLELKRREFIRIIKKGDAVTAELKRQISDAEGKRDANSIFLANTSESGDIQNYNPKPKPNIKEETEKSNQSESIMELASRGLEPHGIAARLNIPIGEVELILRLNTIIKSENSK